MGLDFLHSLKVPEETGTAASKLRSGDPRGSADLYSHVIQIIIFL